MGRANAFEATDLRSPSSSRAMSRANAMASGVVRNRVGGISKHQSDSEQPQRDESEVRGDCGSRSWPRPVHRCSSRPSERYPLGQDYPLVARRRPGTSRFSGVGGLRSFWERLGRPRQAPDQWSAGAYHCPRCGQELPAVRPGGRAMNVPGRCGCHRLGRSSLRNAPSTDTRRTTMSPRRCSWAAPCPTPTARLGTTLPTNRPLPSADGDVETHPGSGRRGEDDGPLLR